jgi:hypothetical protein
MKRFLLLLLATLFTTGALAQVPIYTRSSGLPAGSAVSGTTVTGTTSVTAPKFIASGGTAPAMGACGTAPSVVGNDSAMFVTVGTGGVATSCAVTFSGAGWTTNAPVCLAQSDADRVAYNVVTTLTTVTVTATAAFTASSHLNILCVGR